MLRIASEDPIAFEDEIMATVSSPPQPLAERFAAHFPSSKRLHEKAAGLFPDGVTHDTRHLRPFPVYFERAAGAHKWDVDGHDVIDYYSGHGALILGHSPPEVVQAVQRQMALGTHFGACHEHEIVWGQWVQRLVPSAERVRFTSSGTEATHMAFRLARMATGRPKVLKFAGHFHGWHDAVMPAAYAPYDGSAVPGVPAGTADATVVIPPNDLDLLERTLAGDPQIGTVILEPTGGHWGAVPIRGPFLQALRELTQRYGQVLIFDEVITGFRVHPGGAQGHYGIRPDLTTLAKILAGGLPGGAVAGRADILNQIEHRPGQPKMRHPGTFNGNPLSSVAGTATLERVATGEPCRQATAMGRLLRQRLNAMFAAGGWPWVAYGEFSMVRLLPNVDDSQRSVPQDDADRFVPYGGDLNRLDGSGDARLLHAFRAASLMNGVDFFGLGGITTAAHTTEDIDTTVAAVARTLELLRAEGLT
jgi:glutamate-1-semialdehyde 2,1-aminomutase